MQEHGSAEAEASEPAEQVRWLVNLAAPLGCWTKAAAASVLAPQLRVDQCLVCPNQYQHCRCMCCAACHLHACRIAASTTNHRSWSMMMAQHTMSSRLQAGQQQVTMNCSMRSLTLAVCMAMQGRCTQCAEHRACLTASVMQAHSITSSSNWWCNLCK
jgi:hypothetical protein